MSQTYEWLLSHDKSDFPQEVNRSITITLDDMSRAYSDLDAHGSAIKTVKSIEGSGGNLQEEVIEDEDPEPFE